MARKGHDQAQRDDADAALRCNDGRRSLGRHVYSSNATLKLGPFLLKQGNVDLDFTAVIRPRQPSPRS